MTVNQQIITIMVVVLGTVCTRFLPFLVFPSSKTPPAFVIYLGTVLSYASLSLLVVYCLKDVVADTNHGLPEAIAILCICGLHRWRKNMLLSISGGTILYMLLIQNVF